MKLKSSFLSGEFWLFAVIALVMLWLESRGISAADIKAQGELFIVKLQDWVVTLGPLILAVVFGIKRTLLKVQQGRAELRIELERLRLGARPRESQPAQLDAVNDRVGTVAERPTWVPEDGNHAC